jgi:hypothetical protein
LVQLDNRAVSARTPRSRQLLTIATTFLYAFGFARRFVFNVLQTGRNSAQEIAAAV